jgi:hypothetical protein
VLTDYFIAQTKAILQQGGIYNKTRYGHNTAFVDLFFSHEIKIYIRNLKVSDKSPLFGPQHFGSNLGLADFIFVFTLV